MYCKDEKVTNGVVVSGMVQCMSHARGRDKSQQVGVALDHSALSHSRRENFGARI